MRIAIVHWSNRQVGGTGSYLRTVLPCLKDEGHDLRLFHEVDGPDDSAPLRVGSTSPAWNVAMLGVDAALAGLRAWAPDLIYAHGLVDPAIEARVLDVAPAVFFAHGYYGTCIDGGKTVSRPVIQPCDRTFGWPCLLHYFPRACGGRSPITMLREFRRQSSRLDVLRRYRAIVTHSSRMRDEYIKHGMPPSQVLKVPYGSRADAVAPSAVSAPDGPQEPWRLLFLGRMFRTKGGRELIQALPEVVTRLGRGVRLTLAGDGDQRDEWQRLAAEITARHPLVHVEFSGWVGREVVDRLLAETHLLVVPSLWPEPYGLVGVEAGRHGVPAAAYAVGGIPDWLNDGVNGVLAPGKPPTVHGLARAVTACLEDPARYQQLRIGAARLASDNLFERHIEALLRVFDDAVQADSPASQAP
jgi:glycosyltransferase involved in cell wall biosynthesis